MRTLLLAAVLLLCGCGDDHSVSQTPPPPPAPFADIAGKYAAALATSSGFFVTHDAAPFVTITIDGQGTATTTAGAVFHLTREADGSFTTDSLLASPGVYEHGAAPASLDVLTMTATAAGNPDGTATYVITKFTSG